MTWVYSDLTRFCLSVPLYSLYRKNNDKKVKKNKKKILPTYPNLFEHLTRNNFFCLRTACKTLSKFEVWKHAPKFGTLKSSLALENDML